MTNRIRSLIAFFAFCVIAVPSAQAQRGRDRDYDGDRDSVECRSQNYSYTRCGVDWRDARMVRQYSGSSCVRGRTWGIDRRGLWVDNGCAGLFVEVGGGHGGGHGGGWNPGPDWDHRFSVTCESRDFRYHFCAADVGGGGKIYVERQISDTACVEGRTWGWNRAGVWVDGGCAATFVFERRWR